MFSEKFNPRFIRSLLHSTPLSLAEVASLVNQYPLNLEQSAFLLSASDNAAACKLVIEAACKLRSARWQRRLFLMPPLYISDGDPGRGGCLDHCVYCPWRNGNIPIQHLKRLPPEAVAFEARHLLSLGYGDVELVAATDSKLLKAERAAEFVKAAKSAGAKNIGINLFPFRQPENYRQLVLAGCTFTIVWQETYQAGIYRKMHPKGPKANFNYRLNAHDRALIGGIKAVGLAFLGGLADWRFETLAAIAHAQYLKEEYGANIIFGMPRWKNGAGIPMKLAPNSYGDQEFEFVGALYSLAVPDSLLWFSTREHFDLSARCAKGGGCMFTLDCSTEVGGYTQKGGFAQFPVYTRSFGEGVKWLQQLGFDPKVNLPW
ncbi:MAG: hypothetical protein M1383_04735 [Patescibacteria group bacterium]|nr:hypothetical protein [Patescibacteria group bacterium]